MAANRGEYKRRFKIAAYTEKWAVTIAKVPSSKVSDRVLCADQIQFFFKSLDVLCNGSIHHCSQLSTAPLHSSDALITPGLWQPGSQIGRFFPPPNFLKIRGFGTSLRGAQ